MGLRKSKSKKSTVTLLGYARVSRGDVQNTRLQVRALKSAGEKYLDAHQRKEAIEMVFSGRKTAAGVARLFKVHPSTIGRIIARNR